MEVKPSNTLNDTRNQFIITPTDKVNGAIAFICQRFYAIVITKEPSLDHDNPGTNQTYIPVNKTNNQVISTHTTFL